MWDQPIGTMTIEGFSPIIMNVAPVLLPRLLGLNNAACPQDESGDCQMDQAMPMIKPDDVAAVLL